MAYNGSGAAAAAASESPPRVTNDLDYEWASEFLSLLSVPADGVDPSHWPQIPISHRPWFIAAVACTFIVVSAVALIGNALFCIVIWRAHQLRTVTNVLMTHLGVANILFVALHSPLFLTRYVYKTDWTMGAFMCKVCSCSEHVTATASFYLMMCVAGDRWLAVFVKTRRLSMPAGALLAVCAWLVALAAASPYMVYFDVVRTPRPLYDMDALLTHLHSGEAPEPAVTVQPPTSSTAAVTQYTYRCALLCNNCEAALLFTGVLVQYAVPLAVIVPSYGHLVYFLASRPKSLGQPTANRERKAKNARRRRNTISTLLAIVGSLVALWAPLYTVAILHRASLLPRDSLHLWIAAHLCASAAVTLTPVLYLTNGTFRAEAYRLVRCMRPLAASAAHAITEYSTVYMRRKRSSNPQVGRTLGAHFFRPRWLANRGNRRKSQDELEAGANGNDAPADRREYRRTKSTTLLPGVGSGGSSTANCAEAGPAVTAKSPYRQRKPVREYEHDDEGSEDEVDRQLMEYQGAASRRVTVVAFMPLPNSHKDTDTFL